jgi:hypothetical protein
MSDKKRADLSCLKVTSQFPFHVPVWYVSNLQLRLFLNFTARKHHKFTAVTPHITISNFPVSHDLKPQEFYEVIIFQLQQEMFPAQAIQTIQHLGLILVGAPGLCLIRQMAKSELPVGQVFSLDTEPSLYQDELGKYLTRLVRQTDDTWQFLLWPFHQALPVGSFLLSFKAADPYQPFQSFQLTNK